MSALVTCKRCGTAGQPLLPLCDCHRDDRQAVRNLKRANKELAAALLASCSETASALRLLDEAGIPWTRHEGGARCWACLREQACKQTDVAHICGKLTPATQKLIHP